MLCVRASSIVPFWIGATHVLRCDYFFESSGFEVRVNRFIVVLGFACATGVGCAILVRDCGIAIGVIPG